MAEGKFWAPPVLICRSLQGRLPGESRSRVFCRHLRRVATYAILPFTLKSTSHCLGSTPESSSPHTDVSFYGKTFPLRPSNHPTILHDAVPSPSLPTVQHRTLSTQFNRESRGYTSHPLPRAPRICKIYKVFCHSSFILSTNFDLFLTHDGPATPATPNRS